MGHFTYILKQLGLIVLAIGLLGGCTKFPANSAKHGASTSSEKPQSPYTMPAEAYLALARNQTGGEQQNLLLLAAGRYIEDGQLAQAESILAQIKALSEVQQDEKNILLAKINIAREQFQSAITRLSSVRGVNRLPQYDQIDYYEMLGSAYEATGNLSYAINERIKLSHLLPEDARRNINLRKLWLSLTRLPAAELTTLREETEGAQPFSIEGEDHHRVKSNPELEGWVTLALIARQSGSNQSGHGDHGILTELEEWQRSHPHHSANALLPSPLSAVEPLLQRRPHQIALLLPLSGALAGPGNAIRDGFLAAYDSNSGTRVEIKAYDSNQNEIGHLYQQAITDGADYVIGPLSKPDVAVVAKMEHPVPTLLLNDTELGSRDNAYRFGLYPANEARQVAYRASKKGLHRALIIAPSGAWGDDIVTAFADQWRASGGSLVERLSYNDQTDLNVAVRDFLHVSAREASGKQYHVANGSASAKRRQDFDMIFLLAYPSKARQIMPLLRYYFAGDVPVYATSTVYGGNTNTIQDKDLDGVIFCDMSWVFYHQLPNKNWPESLNSYNRLYAMGMDSYFLAMEFNRLVLFPAMQGNENTGVLYLNGAHQIGRVLAWGQFRGGVAQLISET